MVDASAERVIVGAWLCGHHTEDIDNFNANDFSTLARLVRSIKNGETDIFEMSKASELNVASINAIKTDYLDSKDFYDILYEQAMEKFSRELARRWVAQNEKATPKEIAEEMKKYVRSWGNLPKAPSDPVGDLMDEFDARRNIPYVPTGLTELDHMMNGIRRKELTAVGARPSVGKSAFVQQVAMHVARKGYKVLYFPLEMSTSAVLERMFMRYTSVSQYEVRTGLKDETWNDKETSEAFNRMQEFFKEGNLLIFERCNDLRVIRELIQTHKPYMIVIDQLEQLKDGNRFWQDKRSRFSHMTHELQAIAMDMNVAVWLACQVNRGADDSMPTMANLKESGTIEEDSDNVILLHRAEDQGVKKKIILVLAKQRNGETGNVNLAFMASKYAFYGME